MSRRTAAESPKQVANVRTTRDLQPLIKETQVVSCDTDEADARCSDSDAGGGGLATGE